MCQTTRKRNTREAHGECVIASFFQRALYQYTMRSITTLRRLLCVALLVAPTVSAFFSGVHQPRGKLTTTTPWGIGFVPTSSSTQVNLQSVDSSLRDKAVRIIIAGAPASGKGTQCERIKEAFDVVHLSTGDMLRAAVAAGTKVGKEAKSYMDSGKLVPDSTIIGVVGDFAGRENRPTTHTTTIPGKRSPERERLSDKRLAFRWIPSYTSTS